MVRTWSNRDESTTFRWIKLILSARKKRFKMQHVNPYRELTQVPLAEKAKVCRINLGKGTRQISPVPLVEGVPALKKAGLSDQGAPTVQ